MIAFAAGRDLIFHLGVAGYQFPEATDPADANWLMVTVSVHHPDGDWTFTDPCLTTTELAELAAWFHLVAQGERSLPILQFMEPCLSFGIRGGESPELEVQLSLESSPNWATPDMREAGITLDFPVTQECAREWAQGAFRLHQLFPPREAGDGTDPGIKGRA